VPLVSIAACLNVCQFPVAEGQKIDQPARPEVIGPHALGNRDREVVHDTPEGVINRLQDDVDGVVHLSGLAADRLYLPSRHLSRGVMWRGLRRGPAGWFRSYSGDGGPSPLPKQIVERLAQQVLDTGIFLEGQLFEWS